MQLETIENMFPFEREAYVAIIAQNKEKENQEKQNKYQEFM